LYVLSADLDKGEIVWKQPLGVIDRLSPLAIPLKFGTPFAGGAISTANGVVLIGASYDERFRAFDIETGERLWEARTPYSANATPMTYMYKGKQHVVVAAGGHSWSPLAKGDAVLAWALPD
jgi:quinoprotein glucose dehydrogenase